MGNPRFVRRAAVAALAALLLAVPLVHASASDYSDADYPA
ncbi:MAG: hypothetical protein QOH68_3990, partial [Nocardioidaceae bacterium]|nr:hypothetical protein [Nocardioidaceae bacterium]